MARSPRRGTAAHHTVQSTNNGSTASVGAWFHMSDARLPFLICTRRGRVRGSCDVTERVRALRELARRLHEIAGLTGPRLRVQGQLQ
jgi:hypothetical protein